MTTRLSQAIQSVLEWLEKEKTKRAKFGEGVGEVLSGRRYPSSANGDLNVVIAKCMLFIAQSRRALELGRETTHHLLRLGADGNRDEHALVLSNRRELIAAIRGDRRMYHDFLRTLSRYVTDFQAAFRDLDVQMPGSAAHEALAAIEVLRSAVTNSLETTGYQDENASWTLGVLTFVVAGLLTMLCVSNPAIAGLVAVGAGITGVAAPAVCQYGADRRDQRRAHSAQECTAEVVNSFSIIPVRLEAAGNLVRSSGEDLVRQLQVIWGEEVEYLDWLAVAPQSRQSLSGAPVQRTSKDVDKFIKQLEKLVKG